MGKHLSTTFFLLEKRFLKTPVYLVLLFLVPMILLGMRAISSAESGVVTIALYAEEADETTARVMKKIEEASSVLRYLTAETEAQAIELVESGRADAAWIFPAEFGTRVAEFAANGFSTRPAMRIYEQEETIVMELARIELFGALYEELAVDAYLSFGDALGERVYDRALTDEECASLLTYYENIALDDALFETTYVEGEARAAEYLLSPMRGMLAILLLLVAFAGRMLYLSDDARGRFARVAFASRWKVSCLYVVAAQLPCAVAILVGLLLVGENVSLPMELCTMVLYVFSCAGFVSLLSSVLSGEAVLGSLIPVILILSLVLSPIFFHLARFHALQLCLPTYVYLEAVYDAGNLLQLAGYGVVVNLLAFGVTMLKKKGA